MAKQKVKDLTAALLNDFLQDKELSLYNTEFVKEGKDWFLRVYLDKDDDADGNMRYISTDDCELVSRWLSEKLDEQDPIEQNYYLEVSSPGLDRTLIKESDYIRFQGKAVEINLYQAIDGSKTFAGILQDFDGSTVTLAKHGGGIAAIPFDAIAKTKLEVIF